MHESLTPSTTANVNFREDYRRVASGHGKAPHHPLNGHTANGGNMDERSPLLPGLPGTHEASHRHRHGFWWHVFLNKRATPGTDSPNPFVRYPAHFWMVVKATLLSSTSCARLCTLPQC
jgi:Ca2+:H+ antiporter